MAPVKKTAKPMKPVSKPAVSKSSAVKKSPPKAPPPKAPAKTKPAVAAKAAALKAKTPPSKSSKVSPAKAPVAKVQKATNPKAQAKPVARTQAIKKAVEKLSDKAPIKVDKKLAVAAAKPAAQPKAAAPKAAAPKVANPVPPKAGQRPAAVQPAAAPRAMPAAVTTKPAQSKLTSPAPAAKAPAAPAPAAQAPAAPAAPKKPVNSRHGFRTNESIVYPAHGVGRIIGIEEQEIAGITLELFVIQFEKDKMTLRVPTSKLASVGMRKLAEDGVVHKAMETLKGRARIKRTMWSRRAQEYEAKINSGDLVSIAEVVRDLYRSEAQPEQSYSERQLYEAALDRMAREIAAVDKVDERGAMQRITEVLSKSAKGRRAAEEDTAEDEAVKAA